MKQKRKKCKNCKKYFKQVYSTLQVCCSTKCAIEYSKKKANKVKKDLEDAKIQDANKKTLQTLKNNVMNACHKYIRLRDKNKHCISCGAQWNKDFQAGHFYKAELYSNLKYNENNIHGQCRQCNLRKDGNEAGYRIGLKNRFNEDYVNNLDNLANEYKKTTFKWDREELKKIRTYYNNLIKTIK